MPPALEKRRYLAPEKETSLRISPPTEYQHRLLHGHPAPVSQRWRTYPDVFACAFDDEASIFDLLQPWFALSLKLPSSKVALWCAKRGGSYRCMLQRIIVTDLTGRRSRSPRFKKKETLGKQSTAWIYCMRRAWRRKGRIQVTANEQPSPDGNASCWTEKSRAEALRRNWRLAGSSLADFYIMWYERIWSSDYKCRPVWICMLHGKEDMISESNKVEKTQWCYEVALPGTQVHSCFSTTIATHFEYTLK